MQYSGRSRFTEALAIQLLTFAVVCTATPAATVPDESSTNPPPHVRVRVYSFDGFSPGLLRSAEIEADRLLREVRVSFDWVDCTPRQISAACTLDLTPQDLVIRVVAKPLPAASTDTLGIAGSTNGAPIALIFYDRMLALRTYTRLLPAIVGRVLAHEIVHMLLPALGHSQLGLMRALWSADDMRPGSFACLGLSVASAQLMKTEALRRALSARDLASK